ncbi:MAG: acyltransferase [Clostridia bacterium]|nr:acyltransferase [Clostridia bacterium]
MAVLIFLLILLFGCKFSKRGECFESSFSKDDTAMLKGAFAFLVILHHLSSYVALPSFAIFKYVGPIAVGGFFLISGYGLCASAKKGESFKKGYFSRRLLPILFSVWIFDIAYFILWQKSGVLSAERIIRALFGWHLWYVPVILIFYIVFYFAFFGANLPLGATVMTAFSFLYIALILLLSKKLPGVYGYWWANSILCFPLGIFYAVYKEKLDGFFKKFWWPSLLAFGALFCASFIYINLQNGANTPSGFVVQSANALLFCITLLILQIKVKFSNPLLSLFGGISLEMYLSHAIFITLLRTPIDIFGYTFILSSDDLFVCGVIIFSVLSSLFVRRFVKFITKGISKSWK